MKEDTVLRLQNVNAKKEFKVIETLIKKILADRMLFTVFILMCLKTALFLNVLNSSGASKFSKYDKYVIANMYIYILFIILFLSISFLFKGNGHLWSIVILSCLFSFLLVADLWYYRGFKSFISLHLLSETQNLNGMGGTVATMGRKIDLIFWVDNIVLIIWAILSRSYYKVRFKKMFRYFVISLAFSLGLIMFFHVIYDYHGTSYNGPDLFKDEWIPYSTMRNLSPLGYFAYDTAQFISDNRPYNFTDADKKEINEYLKYKNEDLPDNKYSGIYKGKNVLIIQVESLENFVLGNKYNDQEITPNLNKMLNNSLYFTNYYEQINNGNSSDADLMTNTSVYPVRRGSTFFRFPGLSFNALPNLLKNEGYSTNYYHSDNGDVWNVKNGVANFGYDKYTYQNDFKQKDAFWMGLTDECFLSQIGDIAAKQKQPFLDYTVTVSSHCPFVNIPDSFKTLNFDQKFNNTYLGGYFQAVHYADKQIGALMDNLDKSGVLDNTVVVIYGDHTGVHKYYGDDVAKMKPQESWWDDQSKLPLIIYSKGSTGEKVDKIGGQIDVMPTLCSLLGVDKSKYENTTFGRNLLNTNRNYALLSNGKIMGQSTLSKTDLEMLEKSFELSDKVIRTDYFKSSIKK